MGKKCRLCGYAVGMLGYGNGGHGQLVHIVQPIIESPKRFVNSVPWHSIQFADALPLLWAGRYAGKCLLSTVGVQDPKERVAHISRQALAVRYRPLGNNPVAFVFDKLGEVFPFVNEAV